LVCPVLFRLHRYCGVPESMACENQGKYRVKLRRAGTIQPCNPVIGGAMVKFLHDGACQRAHYRCVNRTRNDRAIERRVRGGA
jgi:hypothetical protein